MDIKAAQELIRTKTLQEVTTYLASRKFDVDLSKMSLMEIMKFMEDKPPLPYFEEYRLASQVLHYNAAVGSLPGPDCQNCLNRGVISVLADDGEIMDRKCHCVARRKCLANAEKSGMGDLLSSTIESFRVQDSWQRAMVATAKEYLMGGHWMAMLGQSGAGKTHLCAAAANEQLNRGKTVVYMPWVVSVKEMKRSAIEPEDYDELFRRYSSCDVLYIDDFLKGKVTEADITIAYELINYRYNNRRQQTIISSELMLSEIIGIDAAVAGRIKERCGNNLVEIGKDPARNYRFAGGSQ